MSEIKTEILLGDSKEVLTNIADNSVDLIFTSPPYADQRKNTYGGIHPDKYVEWFFPISEQLLRVMKPTGTFVLNIKEKAVNGERHTYVMELIIAMKKQGWLWTEEFIWHKKNSYPGKWPNRFRDSWERLLQFNKEKKFNMYQEEVMVPVGDWAKTRLKKLSETDKQRDESKVGSGFGKNISNWLERDKAYPTNVLHLATECNNKNHSAAFPESLPEWFIKLFSKEGDTILDPFMGSGTTNFVAQKMGRKSIGIDISYEYYNMVIKKLNSMQQLVLMEPKEKSIFIKAKNILKAQDLIQAIIDAYLSSSEEGIFGDWLEGLAIFINKKVYKGRKSGVPGVDLEFDKDHIRYIISVKSGPNWGNNDQVKKMIDNFNSARKVLRTSGSSINVIAINGCCYGQTTNKNKYKLKGDYYKYCGQVFWSFISGEENLYTEIIEPLGSKAKERNDEFMKSYAQVINKFTREFIQDFCNEDGQIEWNKLVEFNSAQKIK